MYVIKEIPEDFVVKEQMQLRMTEGIYSYYLLRKRNLTTIDAIAKIAREFRISPKYINFAGTKDKVAITEQYISISKGPAKGLDLPSLKLTYLGKGNERINLGTHKANRFEIVVRNITEKPRPITKMRNLFDSQRFGKLDNNHKIGKLLVQKKFRNAVTLIDDDRLKDYLADNPNDVVGALKTLPKKLLQLYIHAYQSHLWNKMAEKSQENTLPLIGFATKLTDEVQEILKSEGLTQRDFVCREIPEISTDGDMRQVQVNITDLKIGNLEDDDLHPGMKKVKIEFSLPKGSYATMAIRQMM
jgi:tRNA pseudouridine13 synthase